MSKPDMKSTARKTNLLLVDDHPGNLLSLEAVFSESEYNLIMAQSGLEAIELIQKHEIAVVLLDVQMPEMDGFETARRIKAIEGCRDVPIIFVTAIYKEDPFIKKGYEVGGIDYFSKPFDPAILRLKVAHYSSFQQKTYLMQERERRLKETEELLVTGRKLADVLQTLPLGVVIADADGRVIHFNDQVMEICGFAQLVKTSSYRDLLGLWNQDGQLSRIFKGSGGRTITSGESFHHDPVHITCPDGTAKFVLSSASPLRSFDGEVVGMVVVVQDVTRHRLIEHDIEQRIQKIISSGIDCGQTVPE